MAAHPGATANPRPNSFFFSLSLSFASPVCFIHSIIHIQGRFFFFSPPHPLLLHIQSICRRKYISSSRIRKDKKKGTARVQCRSSSKRAEGGKKGGRIHGAGSGALLRRPRQFSRAPSTGTRVASDVTGAGFISLQASGGEGGGIHMFIKDVTNQKRFFFLSF